MTNAIALLVLAAYDPLATPNGLATELRSIHDAARKRDIPVKVYRPASQAKAAPVILYSHGLGGSREASTFMGEHWAKRGYVCVFMQHAGSDEGVWRGVKLGERMKSMNSAANAQNYLLRAQAVKVVLDELERWNQAGPLKAKLDLARIGMCGHSFGAQTTQAVSGQSAGRLGARLTDSRIKAAIPFSPGSPKTGDPAVVFGSVKVPWMLMTGTHDTAPIGGQTVEDRLNVYPHLPKTIDRYELVLWGAEHSVFSDRALPFDELKPNPNHHRYPCPFQRLLGHPSEGRR